MRIIYSCSVRTTTRPSAAARVLGLLQFEPYLDIRLVSAEVNINIVGIFNK